MAYLDHKTAKLDPNIFLPKRKVACRPGACGLMNSINFFSGAIPQTQVHPWPKPFGPGPRIAVGRADQGRHAPQGSAVPRCVRPGG